MMSFIYLFFLPSSYAFSPLLLLYYMMHEQEKKRIFSTQHTSKKENETNKQKNRLNFVQKYVIYIFCCSKALFKAD